MQWHLQSHKTGFADFFKNSLKGNLRILENLIYVYVTN